MSQTRSLVCKLLFVLFLAGTFHATAQPVVTSFSPASGQPGTSVTISGSDFNAVAANNIVFLAP